MSDEKKPTQIGQSNPANPLPNNTPWWAFWDWTMDKATKIRWTAYQRTANEFLVYAAGYWSMIYIILQLVLKFLSTPDFSFTLLTPLWASCLITGAVTLGLSIYYTYQFYQLHTNDTATVNSLNDDVRDIVKEIRERKAQSDLKTQELSFKQQCLFYWDRVHTFLIDSYAVMSIASIFIFLITSVFGAEVIHPALIIGAGVAIGYGIVSTMINHSGSNSREEAIQKSKNNFDTTLRSVNHLIEIRKSKQLISSRALIAHHKFFQKLTGLPEDQQNQFSKKEIDYDYRQALADAQTYSGYQPQSKPSNSNIEEMTKELQQIVVTIPPNLEIDYKHAINLKQRLLAASRTDGKISDQKDSGELSDQICKEIENSDKEEFSFTNWEKWDIFCAFIEFKAGSIIYLTLPLILDMMGIPPLSTELFWGIVVGTGVVYGLINGFYKIKTLEEEKWLHIDSKMDIPKIFDEVTKELEKPDVVQLEKQEDSKGWLANLADSFYIDAENLYDSVQKKLEATSAYMTFFQDASVGDVTDDSAPAPAPNTIKYLPDSDSTGKYISDITPPQ